MAVLERNNKLSICFYIVKCQRNVTGQPTTHSTMKLITQDKQHRIVFKNQGIIKSNDKHISC